MPDPALNLLQEQIPERRSIDAYCSNLHFRYFVEAAWDIVEPAKAFMPNWHIDAICDHLEAVTDGHILNLLINIPPGHAKSLLVSVLWQAWVWLCRNAKWRAMFTSYQEALSLRDAERTKNLLESNWVRETFNPTFDITGVMGFFKNSESGFRMSFGVGGKGTGFRGDALICDDPLNVRDQHSEVALNHLPFWWDEVMSSRFNDLARAVRVIIMQRVSGRDLSAHVIEKGDYVHLMLPTRYEPDRKCFTIIGFQDPREHEGDLLFPALFPKEVIDKVENKEMGATAFAGQHQQRPAPKGGGVWKRHWWRYWKPAGLSMPPVKIKMLDGSVAFVDAVDKPDKFDDEMQSWDCTFKAKDDNDFVAGGYLGRKGADKFLLEVTHDRLTFTQTLTAMRTMHNAHPHCGAKLIEETANGAAIVDTLIHEIPGIIPRNPEGGKYARASAVVPTIEAGNVHLPHPLLEDWVEKFISECEQFPNGAHDDFVDMLSQALNRWQNSAEPNIRLPGQESR